MSQTETSRRFPPWVIVVLTVAALAILGMAAGAAFLMSGVYDIGADVPHTKPVFWLVDHLRDRSVDAHAAAVAPPADLADPRRIAAGAQLYDKLCAACHLGPGLPRTDLSRGLYPQPPRLAYGTDLTPAQQFWVIKHGVKLTGMPSWGKTHKDEDVWNLVAFLKKLPDLDSDQYRAIAAGSAAPPAAQ
jgi:mono/diheme cytochrome c family protein